MPTKQESQPAPNVVLGTAGHIDHGKSSLVRALTGTDPDRLAEEKKRGITIELGFAQLKLPDGTAMGVVDVPGHEHFVRQMIAGSTGIDLALLVIAADDGIMPQTIEHLAVPARASTSCAARCRKPPPAPSIPNSAGSCACPSTAYSPSGAPAPSSPARFGAAPRALATWQRCCRAA